MDFGFLKWTAVPKKSSGNFLELVCIFLKNQTVVSEEDFTMFVKNILFYRQSVSIEICKLANTPGVMFFLLLRIQSPRFLS